MLDRATMEGLDKEHQELAKAGLQMIVESGLFQQQILIEREAILTGDATQDDEELARDILAFRKRTQFLEEFIQFANSFK